jgi:hypothetical protein
MIRYTCRRELLPIVEATLAASSYCIALPRQQSARDRAVVMANGMSTILLTETREGNLAAVEVYGAPGTTVVALLDALPLALDKQPRGQLHE